MLGINCIILIFGYSYFSQNTFPKIKQKLGGQLTIRLNVFTCIQFVWHFYIHPINIALTKREKRHILMISQLMLVSKSSLILRQYL